MLVRYILCHLSHILWSRVPTPNWNSGKLGKSPKYFKVWKKWNLSSTEIFGEKGVLEVKVLVPYFCYQVYFVTNLTWNIGNFTLQKPGILFHLLSGNPVKGVASQRQWNISAGFGLNLCQILGICSLFSCFHWHG